MITIQLEEQEFDLIIEFLKEAKRDPLQSKKESKRIGDILDSFEKSETSGFKSVDTIEASYELLNDVVNGSAPNLFHDHENSQRIINIYCNVLAWILDNESENIQGNIQDIARFLYAEGYKPETSKLVNKNA